VSPELKAILYELVKDQTTFGKISEAEARCDIEVDILEMHRFLKECQVEHTHALDNKRSTPCTSD
jgi:hypothetical protein